DEADLFKALGLDYIPPELREHTGEIEAAAEHHIPDLIEADDLQGTFHSHTVAMDGHATLEEMVQAARKLGLKYLGIGDHSQSQEEMTARIVKAVSHPRVTMLGHATGRLLLRREGYKVDLEAVLQAAAKYGTQIEINAHPQRLDIDWIHCKRAKALGVQLVINPDGHNTGEIA